MYTSQGTTTLTNVTISGNTASGGGGALYAGRYGYGTTLNINNSTIAYNTAGSYGGGLQLYYGVGLTLRSSIVSYNSASSAPDISQYNAFSADHSLIATAEGHSITDGTNNNIVGQEALLFPLGDYGGPTLTHTLKDTSPCVSAGDNTAVLVTDQRGTGYPRSAGAGVDMGAVEYAANTTLSVARAGNSTGTVSGSPGAINCGATCSDAFDPNTTVTLTATPDTKTTFAGWSGDCTGTGTCTVTMAQARSVTATFNWNIYDLTVTKDGTGTGTVTSAPSGIGCGVDCTEPYDYNASVTLTATPDAASSTFGGWSGACTGTNTTCDVTMTQAQDVTATFTLNQYTVTANATGNGSGTISSDTGGISYSYQTTATGTTSPIDHGTSITLTATADTGSTVTWTGCAATGGTNSAATCTFSALDGDKNVTATFSLDTFTLSVTLEGAGTGTVTSSPAGIACDGDCTEIYTYGTIVTLTATPDTPFIFKGWTGACASTEPTCDVTLTEDLNVGARFGTSFPWSMFMPSIINNSKGK